MNLYESKRQFHNSLQRGLLYASFYEACHENLYLSAAHALHVKLNLLENKSKLTKKKTKKKKKKQ